MTITIALGSRELEFSGDTITIGRDPQAKLSLPDDTRLSPRHAILRQVAGRWMIEAQGSELLQVGEGRPTQFAWLTPGDVIRLTENGPELIFQPNGKAAPAKRFREPPAAVPPRPAPPRPAPPQVTHGQTMEAKTAAATAPATAARTFPQPLVWVLSGAALVLLGVGIGTAVLRSGNNSPSESSDRVNAASEEPNEPVTVAPSDLKKETVGERASVADALYLVLLQHPDQPQVYQLGTAWAVAPRQLVTSGAIVQAVETLRETLPRAFLRSPGVSREFAIVGLRKHPEYRRAVDAEAAARAEADALRTELEQAEPSDQDALTAKLVAAEERRYQALERQVHFDLGILEVDRDLPHQLSSAPLAPDSPRVGARLTLHGLPFPMREILADPDTLTPPMSVPATVVLRQLLPDSREPARLLVRTQRDLAGENWSGSPVVNAAGRVVGIYSRPTPPPFNEDETPQVPTVPTHDIAEIARLREFAAEIP